MTVNLASHSRLQSGNPFYETVKDHLDTSTLETRLILAPLAGIDVKTMSLERRHELLDKMQEEMFEPTLTSLDTTTRIFRMMKRGLQAMDPTKASVRKMTMTIARFAGAELHTLPWFTAYALGMTLKGPTGVGKTYEVMRALNLIPQRIDHSECVAAGWTHMVQATWLFVPMSHDGSLGGLLYQILCSLDAAIETRYSQDRSITRLTNEKLAIQVGIILRNHGVGLLVLDEIQERNFANNARGMLAATFFLRLLNFGIPIVLIGNPKGIDAIKSFSQDMRRLGAAGSIEMHPHECEEYDWNECLADAIWDYDVMPDQHDRSFMTSEFLFQYSGGIRDYACRIRAATQRLALDLGRTAVSKDDFETVFYGPDFSNQDRELIAGFRDKNYLLLSQFADVPWEFYGKRWGLLKEEENTSKANSASQRSWDKSPVLSDDVENSRATKEHDENDGGRKTVVERDKQAVKRKRARAEKLAAQRDEAKKVLGNDDIRASGLQECLISGFEAARGVGKKV